MKTYIYYLAIIFLALSVLHCDKKEDKDKICFTVSGTQVTVHNMWSDGDTYTKDFFGLAGVNLKVERSGETHTLNWSNIAGQGNTITSFNVIIDGKNYSYPKNKCDGSSNSTILY